MKIAMYVRINTSRPAEESKKASLDDQIAQINTWAQREGHEVCSIYRDIGSASTDDLRTDFRRMMADACSLEHPYEAVVVTSFSRFYRDTYGLVHHEMKLRRARVSLISITQPIGEEEAGQLVRQVLSSFYEYERTRSLEVISSAVDRLGIGDSSKPAGPTATQPFNERDQS